MFYDEIELHPADCDETANADLRAYNAAFRELGLRWRWDAATYEDLSRIAGERDRICRYVESNQPHLLKAYEKDFLANLIYSTKQRCSLSMQP